MVSSVILLVSVTIAVSLLNFTNRNARSSQQQQDAQAAISDDLANILRVNDRYICTTTTSCSVDTSAPNEDRYMPSGWEPDDSRPSGLNSTAEGIKAKCDSGFGSSLASTVNGLSTPTSLSQAQVSRSASAVTGSNLYTVTWSNSSGTVLRQVTLYPTVAGWCP